MWEACTWRIRVLTRLVYEGERSPKYLGLLILSASYFTSEKARAAFL